MFFLAFLLTTTRLLLYKSGRVAGGPGGFPPFRGENDNAIMMAIRRPLEGF